MLLPRQPTITSRANGTSPQLSVDHQQSPQLSPPWPAQLLPARPVQLSPGQPQLSPQHLPQTHSSTQPVACQLPFCFTKAGSGPLQLAAPGSSQHAVPGSLQPAAPSSSQLAVPGSLQPAAPGSSIITQVGPGSLQATAPSSSQLAVPGSSRLTGPGSLQFATTCSPQLATPGSFNITQARSVSSQPPLQQHVQQHFQQLQLQQHFQQQQQQPTLGIVGQPSLLVQNSFHQADSTLEPCLGKTMPTKHNSAIGPSSQQLTVPHGAAPGGGSLQNMPLDFQRRMAHMAAQQQQLQQHQLQQHQQQQQQQQQQLQSQHTQAQMFQPAQQQAMVQEATQQQQQQQQQQQLECKPPKGIKVLLEMEGSDRFMSRSEYHEDLPAAIKSTDRRVTDYKWHRDRKAWSFALAGYAEVVRAMKRAGFTVEELSSEQLGGSHAGPKLPNYRLSLDPILQHVPESLWNRLQPFQKEGVQLILSVQGRALLALLCTLHQLGQQHCENPGEQTSCSSSPSSPYAAPGSHTHNLANESLAELHHPAVERSMHPPHSLPVEEQSPGSSYANTGPSTADTGSQETAICETEGTSWFETARRAWAVDK
ncbi:hypothetical protein DUNSADRAFT_16352 [Dunaliella salina]|uniref:Uncharacterized protein n=1 Tax=Dunaliella salina TaxID=3046 RepID=A0ABQ7H130_DUNSA|nr:hypothetical protein DUNSADRAFT_16352 [Dunaliella salina]|eukprot:KAF5840554.1 hypothetical protein DUNSADRAFT_16352 [Dunaliella salina]